MGDPRLPGNESEGQLHLHRWCQWISQYHPGGVYDGEHGKRHDYSQSLPPFLLRHVLKALRNGIACTGISGEDYAVPGHNAIVLQTRAPSEAVAQLERLRARPSEACEIRAAGAATARNYAWETVITRTLLPQLELAAR